MNVLSHCVLCIVLLLSVLADASAETYVVAIGNNIGSPEDVPLHYAESDARSVVDVMQELAGVAPSHAILVRNGSAKSVRKTLLETNLRIRQAQARSQERSLLMVYYSGHADQTGLHLGDTVLPFDELRNIIESSPATARVLILDSCRSGGVTRVKGAKPAEVFSIQADNRVQAEGVAIITSSSAWEDSHESERLRGSFFTHHFVTALRGAADKDKDSTVTLNEAYSYSYRQTLRSSGKTQSLQHPTYSYDLKGKGDLPLTRLVGGTSQSAMLVFEDPGYYLVVRGQEGGELVHEVRTDERNTALQVAPGNYFIQRREQSYYLEYQLKLKHRQQELLRAGDGRRIDYARLVRKGSSETPLLHSFAFGVAGRNSALEGVSAGQHLIAEYRVDLSFLSLQTRIRFHQNAFRSNDGILSGELREWGAAVGAHRFADTSFASFGVGMTADFGMTNQRFESRGAAPNRSAFTFGTGLLGTIQIPLWSSFTLDFETGPWIQFEPRAYTNAGTVVEESMSTTTLWWAALKLGVRL